MICLQVVIMYTDFVSTKYLYISYDKLSETCSIFHKKITKNENMVGTITYTLQGPRKSLETGWAKPLKPNIQPKIYP